jgi:hypothetical protein
MLCTFGMSHERIRNLCYAYSFTQGNCILNYCLSGTPEKLIYLKSVIVSRKPVEAVCNIAGRLTPQWLPEIVIRYPKVFLRRQMTGYNNSIGVHTPSTLHWPSANAITTSLGSVPWHSFIQSFPPTGLLPVGVRPASSSVVYARVV